MYSLTDVWWAFARLLVELDISADFDIVDLSYLMSIYSSEHCRIAWSSTAIIAPGHLGRHGPWCLFIAIARRRVVAAY